MTMYDVEFQGCSLIPLAGYLKSLAVIRILSSKDPKCLAWWERDRFFIRSAFSRAAITELLLRDYEPTPVVAPWNGGSGFHPNDSKQALTSISKSHTVRLRLYRATIDTILTIMGDLELYGKPDKKNKQELVERCRSFLPDEAVEWMDAVILLTADTLAFPSLVGTGGNDGRLEFTNNFMQHVCQLFEMDSGHPTQHSASWLNGALWQEPTSGLVDAAVGQFNPGGAGGPNASAGYEGSSRVNPWDFVLTLEGCLMFSASASRRLSAGGEGMMSFPFTVHPSPVGYTTKADKDRDDARAEMWMPIWRRPATFPEIAFLFREGRVQTGRRTARNGLDFARACASLGVDRGIESFQRYGFLMRSGKAYLSVPLTRVPVQANPQVDLLRDLDSWAQRIAPFSNASGTPVSFKSAWRELQGRMFDLTLRSGSERVLSLLIAVGQLERQMRVQSAARQATRQPLVLRSPDWISMASSGGGPEAAIASALAGITDPSVGPIRLNMSPIVVEGQMFKWSSAVGHEVPPRMVWGNAPLTSNLVSVLRRRALDWHVASRKDIKQEGAPREKPFYSRRTVDLSAIAAFVDGRVNDERIQGLLWGMSPMDPSVTIPNPPVGQSSPVFVPWAYCVLRILFTPEKWLRQMMGRPKDWTLPIPDVIWGLLESRNSTSMDAAVEIAERRLFASGLCVRKGRDVKIISEGIDPARLAASLAIPLSKVATRQVLRMVCPDMIATP